MLLSAREFAVLEALLAAPRRDPVARAARGPPLRLGRGDREQRGRGVRPPAAQKLGAELIRNVRGVGYSSTRRKRRRHAGRCARCACAWLAARWCALLAAGARRARWRRHLPQRARARPTTLFDYQLRQMALSLRDQGEIAPPRRGALADGAARLRDPGLDASTAARSTRRARTRRCRARALLGLRRRRRRAAHLAHLQRGDARARDPGGAAGRVGSGSPPHAALRSVAAAAAVAPLLALAIWWLVGAHAGAAAAPDRATVRTRDARSLEPMPAARPARRGAPLVECAQRACWRASAARSTRSARFVADAAHELRSPLTALKLQLQLLRARPTTRRATAAHAALAPASIAPTHLVEQLLTLARSEPGRGAGAAPSASTSAELARQALGRRAPLAADARQRRSSSTRDARRSLVAGDAQRAARAGAQPRRQRGALFAATASRVERAAWPRGATAPRAAGRRRRPRHPAGRARARVRPLLSPRRARAEGGQRPGPGDRAQRRRSATARRWRWPTRRWAACARRRRASRRLRPRARP